MYILQHIMYISYTRYRHVCTRLCQVGRIPDDITNMQNTSMDSALIRTHWQESSRSSADVLLLLSPPRLARDAYKCRGDPTARPDDKPPKTGGCSFQNTDVSSHAVNNTLMPPAGQWRRLPGESAEL